MARGRDFLVVLEGSTVIGGVLIGNNKIKFNYSNVVGGGG